MKMRIHKEILLLYVLDSCTLKRIFDFRRNDKHRGAPDEERKLRNDNIELNAERGCYYQDSTGKVKKALV